MQMIYAIVTTRNQLEIYTQIVTDRIFLLFFYFLILFIYFFSKTFHKMLNQKQNVR